MYDPKRDATRDQERFASDGETVFAHVRRVVDHWKAEQGSLCFEQLPERLQRDHPDVFGRISPERLGILCALVWLYLGADSVNERAILKWFADSVR